MLPFQEGMIGCPATGPSEAGELFNLTTTTPSDTCLDSPNHEQRTKLQQTPGCNSRYIPHPSKSISDMFIT